MHLRDLLRIVEPDLAAHLVIERAERINRSFIPADLQKFLNLHRTLPETLTQFATAVGSALRVLQAEREPLAELERVLEAAMSGLEGLAAEQSGQWLRIAWYFVLLAYHRREPAEYEVLVETIREQATESKFYERREVDNVMLTMAQWHEQQIREHEAQAEA